MKINREKLALGLAVLGIILWFGQNVYFGWHRESQSSLESALDFSTWGLWVLAYFIRPTKVEIHKTAITCQTVDIIKPDLTQTEFERLKK